MAFGGVYGSTQNRIGKRMRSERKLKIPSSHLLDVTEESLSKRVNQNNRPLTSNPGSLEMRNKRSAN